jgi:N-acetylmuramoyl-L-alanine amidase
MNKYKSLMIVMFFILIFSFSKVNAIVKGQSLLGKAICLDAGHGGLDSGATAGNIYEKDINLEIVNVIGKELVANGSYVILTRNGDYELTKATTMRKRNDLYKRAMIINTSNCDLYLSIHLNSTTEDKWRGLQVFYNSKLSENKVLAEILTESLKNDIDNVRDLKKDNSYYMYRHINIPGVLIEVGFLSNYSDRKQLINKDYQEQLSISIVKGIKKYLNN